MGNKTTLACQTRAAGKASRHRLKKQGQVPGIIYGHGEAGTGLSFDERMINRLFAIHGPRGLFSLELDGSPVPILAVVRELQRDPLSGNIIHVDFMKVDAGQRMDTAIGVRITGEEDLLDSGCLLQTGIKEIQVNCLPQDLPEYLVFDVSLLHPGDQVLASHLILPAGVHMVSEPDLVILTILAEQRGSVDETQEQSDAEGE